MAALVWAMMGIAIWHFTIFVPDRFGSSIVGAFASIVQQAPGCAACSSAAGRPPGWS